MKAIKGYFPLIAILAIVFIGFGDKFLPEPLKGASTTTRTTVNNFVIGLIPNRQPKTNPYQRTEDAIKQQEEGAR
jgi:hypothetical protein